MNDREFFLKRREAEFPAFMKVLRALPQDRADYKPHDRSPSAGQLMWTLAGEFKSCLDVVQNYKAEWTNLTPPSPAEMIAQFERHYTELGDHVAKMDDAAWNKTAKFYVDGKVVLEQAAGTFLWFILFDAIHHRGQLTAYLRPMGAKVPSVYGPSADDSGS